MASASSAIRHFSSVKSMEELRRRAVRKGILMQDVDVGNPCVVCGDRCPGFQLHVWRKICQHCKCSKENHRVMASPEEEPERWRSSAFRLKPVREEKPAENRETGKEGMRVIPNGEANARPVIEDHAGENYRKTEHSGRDESFVEQVGVSAGETACQTGDLELGTGPVVEEIPVDRVELSRDKSGFDEAVLALFGGPDSDSEGRLQDEGSAADELRLVSGRKAGDEPRVGDGFEDTEMDPKPLGFIWIPGGLTEDQVIRFMETLPEEKAPKIGSRGVDYWLNQQASQLPEHDTDPDKCNGLDEDDCKKQEAYRMSLETGMMREGKATEIVDDGVECWNCHGMMLPGAMAVKAEVGSGCYMWHPACFTCETDSELLVPLIYFYKDDKIFCGRHYGETIMPRCHACDELIFCQHYTSAEKHSWHQKHFCCFSCDQPLAVGDQSQPYVNHDDHVYCTKCYSKDLAEKCHGCGNPIAAGDKHLIHEDTNWHTACFICSRCEAELASMPFYRRDEKYLCQTCFEGAFGKVCAKCGLGIETSSKSFVLADKHWHDSCFVCSHCNESLAGSPMVNHETGLYCPNCYYEVLGEKCHGCKKPLGSEGGVTYGDATYHHRCFSCEECHKTLAGKQFSKSPDGNQQHLCLDCFDHLFAKKCSACDQLIIASSPSYMALGDQVWHETCFICSQCKSSLSGAGFYQRDGALLCANCG